MPGSPLKIAIGEDNFRILREKGAYFVDRSHWIEEIANTAVRVSLITRPRRMGKTLNLSMLHYFFSCTEPNTTPLFEGLKVTENPEIMAQQGQYPTIFLSLKGIRAKTWEESLDHLRSDLSTMCRRFEYLLNSEKVSGYTKKEIQSVLEGNEPILPYQDCLKNLCEALHAHHGKRVILLIDEYDAPIQRAYTNGFYEPMIAFIQRFLDLLKTSEHLEKAVLTGCLRIAKESLFSTLNNFRVFTIQESSPFDAHFGFTPEEVDSILTDAGLSERRDIVNEWYNGYVFGETTIYNPWSVLNFVADGGKEPKPYWLNTSENAVLHQRLEEARLGLRGDLETLLKGGAIEREVKESITFRDLGAVKEDVWSVLVHTGYLNAKIIKRTKNGNFCQLRLPNFEVGEVFSTFVDYLIPEFDFITQQAIFRALRDGDCDKLATALTDLVQFLSYHDNVAKQPEAAFHCFVLGLLAIGRSVYKIDSNPESGTGRADILMTPKKPDLPGIVVEFKSIKADQDVESELNAALGQVGSKRYADALEKAGVEQIRRYAVVLREKEVFAKKG